MKTFTLIDKLDQFELTNNKVSEFRKIFPHAKIIGKVSKNDTIEVLEPKFPICVRRALVNGRRLLDVNFADEMYGSTNVWEKVWFNKYIKNIPSNL